jgi:hypothetical protein
MSRSDLSDQPNPFAFIATEGFQPKKARGSAKAGFPQSATRKAAMGALKYLLAVVLVFAALLAVRQASGMWLLSRLTQDLHSLPSDQQQQRLVQIAGFGRPAIPHLVAALASDDLGTARTAHEILRGLQNQWSVLTPSTKVDRHLNLVAAIAESGPRLPDDRTGWATSLIQQSILESVDQSNDREQLLYQNANDALAILSHNHRSGPSILNPRTLNSTTDSDIAASGNASIPPRRIVAGGRLLAQARPLPVNQTDAGAAWTDWPGTEAAHAPTSSDGSPTIYRSGASRRPGLKQTSMRLKPIMADQTVVLKPIEPQAVDAGYADAGTSPGQVIMQANSEVQSGDNLVETALQAYDDRSVMQWLSSDQSSHREAAKLELMSRGYEHQQLQYAKHLFDPDPSVRLHFVQQLNRSARMDPRPWLKLMSVDENRTVRLAVVTALGSMSGHDIDQQLQRMMAAERDPSVAAKIRHTLDLGKQASR